LLARFGVERLDVRLLAGAISSLSARAWISYCAPKLIPMSLREAGASGRTTSLSYSFPR
jgi:hypothetical protein